MQDIVWDPQMTSYDMASLEGLVDALRPTHSLEVGSWKGLSSSIIARYSQVLYCVDTWEGAENEPHMTAEAKQRSILEIFIQNMRSLKCFDRVKPMVMSSMEALVMFKDDHLDFIYIDGDHSYNQVKSDLGWWDKLKIGGIMAGHDCDKGHPGVVQALNEMFEGQYTIMQKSSVWFIQKGGMYAQ